MGSINNYFDKILIINLDQCIDRWKKIKESLHNANITNYERMKAIRLPNLNGIPKEYYSNLVSHHKIHKYYKIGITGDNMSHINCIKLAKERNYNNILILEDDAAVREDANEIFEKIIPQLDKINWDMLYLGSVNQQKNKNRFISENLIRCIDLLSAHAYSVRNQLYDKIIAEGQAYGAELDNYYKFCIQKKYNCLCTNPKLFWQVDGMSITTQKFSDIKKDTKE